MLRRIDGTVREYRAVDVHNVQFEVHETGEFVELSLGQPWIIRRGDWVAVVGEDDGRSGTFHGYAYRNHTRKVCGKSDPGISDGFRHVFIGLLFFWAIFPLLIHVPAGLRRIRFGRKIDLAAAMIGC